MGGIRREGRNFLLEKLDSARDNPLPPSFFLESAEQASGLLVLSDFLAFVELFFTLAKRIFLFIALLFTYSVLAMYYVTTKEYCTYCTSVTLNLDDPPLLLFFLPHPLQGKVVVVVRREREGNHRKDRDKQCSFSYLYPSPEPGP